MNFPHKDKNDHKSKSNIDQSHPATYRSLSFVDTDILKKHSV